MIKGILLDKDGTLADFSRMWLESIREAIRIFIRHHKIDIQGIEEQIFYKIGIFGSVIDSEGTFACKIYTQTADDIRIILEMYGISIDTNTIKNEIYNNLESDICKEKTEYVQFVDTKALFDELHNRGIYIGVATADVTESTKKCLEKFDVLDRIDYLGTDDGVLKPKPATDMCDVFADKFNLKYEEIMIVGDTGNDIKFARNCRCLAVGVLSGLGTKEVLKDADYIIKDIGEIPMLLDSLN